MSLQSPASPLPAGAAAVQRYALLVRIMHWLMAICFVFMWISGLAMRTHGRILALHAHEIQFLEHISVTCACDARILET